MNDFRIRMRNALQFSRCEAPDKAVLPISGPQPETLIVELRGDILTIADTHLFTFVDDPSHAAFAANLRIHARRKSADAAGVDFEMLETIEAGESRPFPVLGLGQSCRLSFGPDGERRLRAHGTDDGGGGATCRGWIFDAVEIR